MAINVSVSDQVQDGYLAAGRGIADGIRAFAENRTNALSELARSPDPTVAGPAVDRLKRMGGISRREERRFLTQSMEGLAQMGAVTMEDLDKFHGANLQGQRALFTQAFTTADLGMRETGAKKEQELELQQKERMLGLELEHKKAAYLANEESQGRIGQAADARAERQGRRGLEEDRAAARMIVGEFDRVARREGWQLDLFDAYQAQTMAPEDAREFLILRREQALAEKEQGGRKVPVVTEIPGYGAIVRDPVTGERVSSSQIIKRGATAGGGEMGEPTPPSPAPPSAARDLVFRKGRAQ